MTPAMIYTKNMLMRTLLLAITIASAGCSASPTAPELPTGAIQIHGTVRYYTFEGGFWAVQGEDGVTYDPMNGLAPAFQRENLKVTLVAKVRNDMGGFHMVGPIVEVLSIQQR
jgi:ABC-type glycerol-3-phosphate transport system substrate-binding protein